jgi:hypothetical protein
MTEKISVDTDCHAEKAWVLGVQRKLYQQSKANPDIVWRDLWGWLTDSRLTGQCALILRLGDRVRGRCCGAAARVGEVYGERYLPAGAGVVGVRGGCRQSPDEW